MYFIFSATESSFPIYIYRQKGKNLYHFIGVLPFGEFKKYLEHAETGGVKSSHSQTPLVLVYRKFECRIYPSLSACMRYL